MFVNIHNRRFKTKMWSDSRLVNMQGDFCLCANCKSHPCRIHNEFMSATSSLKVAAPIIACADFIEANGNTNSIDNLLGTVDILARAKSVESAHIMELART